MEKSLPALVRALLDAAKGHHLFAFYHVAACTGARGGELLNLRWSLNSRPEVPAACPCPRVCLKRDHYVGGTSPWRGRMVAGS